MRVAMIPTPDLQSEWGSTLYGVLLASRLAGAGVDMHVYCRNHPASVGVPVTFRTLPLPLSHPVLIEDGIRDTELLAFSQMLAEAVVADHATTPFDVIHAHYATITGLAGLVAHTVTGAPLVLSTFGRDVTVGASRDPRYARMVALTLAHAHAVVASDAGLARQIERQFALDPARVSVLEMPVDDTLFASATPQPHLRAGLVKDAEFLVVNVSSCFGEEKGVEVLLRAVAVLADTGIRVAVAIIGADDYVDRRREHEIRDCAIELGIERLVTFVGRVPHRDVPAYVATADLFVDPRTVDNFSSSLLEAVFAGAIVIGPDSHGNRQRFDGVAASILHAAGDARDLATRMRAALTDESFRMDVKQALQHWRREHGFRYMADHATDGMLAVYRSVTKEAATVRP